MSFMYRGDLLSLRKFKFSNRSIVTAHHLSTAHGGWSYTKKTLKADALQGLLSLLTLKTLMSTTVAILC